jgi:hypothetical protein
MQDSGAVTPRECEVMFAVIIALRTQGIHTTGLSVASKRLCKRDRSLARPMTAALRRTQAQNSLLNTVICRENS